MKKRSQTSTRERFPTQVPRPIKRSAGATGVGLTPLNVRAGKRVTLDDATRAHVQQRMARQLGKLAVLIERSTVRFDDINGKRGGIDVSCSINVVLTGRPSVVVEERAATVRAAFDAAAATAQRAVRRVVGRAEMSARPSRTRRKERDDEAAGITSSGPPEELGVSATRRKSGDGSTASRNLKKNLAGLTSALEDSAQGTPSRKSTRGSAGRAKRDGNLKQRETRKLHSSKERARRNIVKQS